MKSLQTGLAVLILLSSAAFATQSSDLLDAFNDVSLETPANAYQSWSGGGDMSGSAFKNYYLNQFDRYINIASKLSTRALSCANGDIPQADGYQSMADLEAINTAIEGTLYVTVSKLKMWINTDNQSALEELNTLIPKLTVSYSRFLFELSNCSGYLYGEMVN